MEQILSFYYANELTITNVFLLMLIIITCMQVHKMNVMRKQMHAVAAEVKKYLICVMEEDDDRQKQPGRETMEEQERLQKKKEKEEEDNRLISAVLEEIFP